MICTVSAALVFTPSLTVRQKVSTAADAFQATVGAVVNLGAMSGLIVNRPESHAGYGASKAAVHHLTKCLAVDWAPRGAWVNAVAPTYVETPMTMGTPANHDRFPIWKSHTPMDRMGRQQEIASAVLYLASPAASLVTGAVLSVDGGDTCW